MEMVRINASDFVQPTRSVVDCAALVAREVSRHLQAGSKVVLSVVGIRGVSSSFFNVILAAAAEALGRDIEGDRFQVETETPTQHLVYRRSLEALAQKLGANG